MPQTEGMNPAQVQRLAATCRREASSIRGAVASVNASLDNTWWRGNDADRFREDWSTDERRRMLEVAAELERIANFLSSKARNQSSTSNF